MRNPVKQPPKDSPTMSVRPSGVMTVPFGKLSSRAATRAEPFGSTCTMQVRCGLPPRSKSKPKFPT
jgi:hypothetical protein